MTQNARKPPMLGNISGFQKHSKQLNYTKKPPYANSLKLRGQNLVICTGSDAWERAKSSMWFAGCKIVLPFGDDPAAYTWSAATGHDVLIAGFGDLEPIDTISRLGVLLLRAGATLVLYAPRRGSITRITGKRQEAA